MSIKAKTNYLKQSVRLILLAVFLYTQFQNLAKFLSRDANTIMVTSVESEHNQEFRHPYYTICLLYYNTTYVQAKNASLRSLMMANWMSIPPFAFHDLLNDISNKPEVYKTWLLTRGSKTNRRLTFIPCFTYHFPNKVIPGTYGGTVRLIFVSKDPAERKEKTAYEFKLYVHDKPGYLNTFMTLQGAPHVRIPGFNQAENFQKPQFFRYRIKKRIVEKIQTQDCDASDNVNDWCVEQFLEAEMGHCILPWKTANHTPCPPCDWDFESEHRINGIEKRCHNMHGFPEQEMCHAKFGPTANCYFEELAQDCLHCDEPCEAIDLEELCTDRKSLLTMIQNSTLPYHYNSLKEFEKKSGCRLPCKNAEYEVTELEATSMAQDIYPGMEFGGLISLELDTDVVTTLKEIQAYDSYDLLSEFSGNLGIIFGLSVVTILNPTTGILVKNKRSQLLLNETLHLVLLMLSMLWAKNSFDKFSLQGRSHERELYKSQESELKTPLLTFCPVFENDKFIAAKGYVQSEMSLDKFTTVMGMNFLLKDFRYKGNWTSQWKFYQSQYMRGITFGQKCRTYHATSMEQGQVLLEFDRRNLEGMFGFIHDFDGYAMTFLHKSSDPKFHIPYDNPRYGQMPNSFTYQIKASSVHDLETKDLCSDLKESEIDPKCYLNYLEEQLECKLNWDTDSGTNCQFPFVYKGKVYTECSLDKTSRQKWCASAVYPNTSKAFQQHWEFCSDIDSDIDIGNDDTDIAEQCQSREDFEALLTLIHDKWRTNPTDIAKDLSQNGCPLPCEYNDYQADLLYKSYDSNLGPDKLRVKLQFQTTEDDIERLTEHLNYALEMLVSDVGNAFGLLLGISLITLVNIFIQSLVAVVGNFRAIKSRRLLDHVHALYNLMKWSLLLAVISYFFVSTFTITLIQILDLSPVQEAAQTVQNADEKVLAILSNEDGLSVESSLAKCSHKDKVGDGFCDDVANNPWCLYDGDDCCHSIKNLKPNQHLYCSECSCRHINQTSLRQIKPGICEFCVFPFKLFEGSELVNDCTTKDVGQPYTCPFSIDKNTLVATKFFNLNCPEKQEWEESPSCFYNSTVDLD